MYFDENGFDTENKEQKAPKGRKGIAVMLAGLCVASAIGGSLLTAYAVLPAISGSTVLSQKSVQPSPSAAAVSAKVQDQSALIGGSAPAISNQSNPIPEIAAKVSPSVVGVKTSDTQFARGQQSKTQDVAYGTGFVISSDGLILTNSHVIEQGQNITVEMNNGKSYPATVKGQDYDSDVAVLKIDATGLTPVAIGDSDKLQVGQQVVAIGNPLGEQLSDTVTVGYLSSLNRTIQSGDRTYHVLQTDAAINPGNSGGVLLNTSGQVVGMTTLKSMFAGVDENGDTISSEGIGFAIPVNYVMDIANQLIANGSIQHPGIGLSYYMMTADDAKNWNAPQGALVESVTSGGPAEKAGIQTDDIITAIDNVPITQISDAAATIKGKGLNATISLTIWRNGQTSNINVVTADLSQNKTSTNNANQSSNGGNSGNGGNGRNGGSQPFGNRNPFRNNQSGQ